MKRFFLAGIAVVGLMGTAQAKTVILACSDGQKPEVIHHTYEWNTERNDGRLVEGNVYASFTDTPSAIYPKLLAGKQSGTQFRIDKTNGQYFVDGNSNPIGTCSEVKPTIGQ